MISDKYAVAEYERRFLLRALPDGVSRPWRITDRYLDGTRLRVRLVETPDGEPLQRKLGHKRRIDPGDPTAIMHTSLYLDESEYAAMSSLPGRTLVKTRWLVGVGGPPAAVDVFEGELEGLIMLEVDVQDADALGSYAPPGWAGPEVTRQEAFTGAALADLDRSGLQALLGSFLDVEAAQNREPVQD